MAKRAILATILWSAALAQAGIVTNITFLSPSTIQAGGSVTIDFGVHFTPVPGSVGSTEFLDNGTSGQVSSCTLDTNACTEIQILTTDSTLKSVFAEALGANTPSAIPNFYPETSAGDFRLTLPYPDAGNWEITTAGTEQEQFSELDCSTPWLGGKVAGAAVCSTIQTVSFTGSFDPGGAPQAFVTVNPAGVAATPEPGLTGVLGGSLILMGVVFRRKSSSNRQCMHTHQTPVCLRKDN